MNYTPQRVTADGSQLVVMTELGQIAVDLKTFDTDEKVRTEIVRAMTALAPPAPPGFDATALLGKSGAVTEEEIAAERGRQKAVAEAAAAEQSNDETKAEE